MKIYKKRAIHFATKELKKYRTERGWTQEQFAEYLSLEIGTSISTDTLRHWEAGTRGMIADTAIEIAKATGIKIMDLVQRKVLD